jgi:hypothetical protein
MGVERGRSTSTLGVLGGVVEATTISSGQTFIMKYVFPTVWISGFGLGTIALWFASPTKSNVAAMRGQFAFAWALGTFFILSTCAGLKRVRVDGSSIYVSNYLREETIPLNMIQDVTEVRWINIHPVTIHFRGNTTFGYGIRFMPKARMFGFWSSHPVVAELKRLAGLTTGVVSSG